MEFCTALEKIMRDRWPSKVRADLKNIHSTTVGNIIPQYPTYVAFLQDYLAVYLLLYAGVDECVQKWGLSKYELPWDGHLGVMEKSMTKTFKELGNEVLLVILHMAVQDIKQKAEEKKKKVSLSFEMAMRGVNTWLNDEYQLAQDSSYLDKRKEAITQRFFPNTPSTDQR